MGTDVLTKTEHTDAYQIAEDVLCLPILITNVCFINEPGASANKWTLVDTALFNSANKIMETAARLFGDQSQPNAIVLTHGHFDHVGAITDLLKHWQVPVYAHPLEIPYLTGKADYPPADPGVDDGLLAKLSPLYPRHSINLGNQVKALPEDGSIPSLPDWRWIHTPGHTPGHISLFRQKDGVLIVGDAFTTVKQESALSVLTQDREVHGPPAYFTTDWPTAWESVKTLAALKPRVVITGHGQALRGDKLTKELAELAENFDQLAIPKQGRYVKE